MQACALSELVSRAVLILREDSCVKCGLYFAYAFDDVWEDCDGRPYADGGTQPSDRIGNAIRRIRFF